MIPATMKMTSTGTSSESGPAIVPGKPEASLLIQAVSHVEKDLKMPPKKMLPASEIALLTEWVRQGAPDPRVAATSTALAADDAWAVEFQKRLDWWSLKPMRPATNGSVDGFIQAAQKAAGLEMAAQASPEVLRRRLSFVLTGLPPSINRSDTSYESYVDELLNSPHFGEHFASAAVEAGVDVVAAYLQRHLNAGIQRPV